MNPALRPLPGSILFASSLVTALGLLSPAGVVEAQTAPTSGMQTIVSDGVERRYLLHVPDDYAGDAGDAIALVLNFHGSGGVPENQVATSGFDALADREGFAVAYPAGVFTNSVSRRSWNANVERGVDDVRFARDVIDDVSGKLNVDPSRIYATGMSGGARMTSRLACELADRLAAAAPVAGLQYPDGCTPARPVSIVAFHGKADRVNQYERSESSRPYWRMGVEEAVEKWRSALGCALDPQVSEITGDVELRVWSSCDGGAAIRFYVDADDGHVWPDGASERIWAFFEQHAR